MAYSAALNVVYNHYLQTYSQTRPSRYDTHKKGELRNIYHSIVEQNRKSPLFLLENTKESREFVVGLKENARLLRNTIASVGGLDEGDVLSKKTAFSSEPEIVDAIFVGDNDNISNVPAFSMKVNRLATGQANTGHMLPAEGKVGLPIGSYSFDVNIGEMNYEFQFQVNDGETNSDIQNRLARLFDNANLGLTAKVVSSYGLSALSLEANHTGTTSNRSFQFMVSDEKTSKTSGAVSYLGLGNVTREAGNAEFLLNGELRSAHSNTFTVEKMFEIQLKGVSDENRPDVQVGLKTSTESISENIANLVDGYNRFLESANRLSDGQYRNRQIVGEMRGIAMLYQDDMAYLGLSVADDGLLSISDMDKLGQLLTGEAGGEDQESPGAGLQTLKSFTNAVLRKSNQISLNPMEYVDKKIIAYKNPGRSFVNPYMISAYSGMMFNSYC